MTEISAPNVLPVIYIAGPYRAETPWRVLANIRTAQEAALRIWKLGGVAICPHSNTGLFDGECTEDVWLTGDMELLRRCDAVLMIGEWQKSQGACAERQLAEDLGLPVFYDTSLSTLNFWITDWKKGARV